MTKTDNRADIVRDAVLFVSTLLSLFAFFGLLAFVRPGVNPDWHPQPPRHDIEVCSHE